MATGSISDFARPVITIEHSNPALARFMELVQGCGASMVADVSFQPLCRGVPCFGRPALEAALAAARREDVFLGDFLGGGPKEKEYYDAEGRVS